MVRTELWMLVCIVAAAPANAVSAAPILYARTNPANNHTYYLQDSALWSSAQNTAVALGGNLVTINDAGEQAWVWDTFSPRSSQFWIGLNDLASEGSWGWISGEPITYLNWNGGEPNNTRLYDPLGEDHVEMQGEYGGKWNDRSGRINAQLSVIEVSDFSAPHNARRVINFTNPQYPQDNTSDPSRVLGPRDSQTYALGTLGSIVLELGVGVTDLPGPDLGVWEETGDVPR